MYIIDRDSSPRVVGMLKSAADKTPKSTVIVNNEPVDYGRLAAILYTPPATLLGIGTQQAGKRLENLTDVHVDPETKNSLKKLMELSRTTNPGTFVRDYVNVGHDLLNRKLVYQGKTHAADDVIYATRKKLAPFLKAIGMSDTDVTLKDDSIEHYNAFKKSPSTAYQQLLKEQYGNASDRALQRYIEQYKGLRWDLLQNAAKTKPNMSLVDYMRNHYTDDMLDRLTNNRLGGRGSEIPHLEDAIRRTERSLLHSNPKAYVSYLRNLGRTLRSGMPEAETNQALHGLDKLKEDLFQRAGYSNNYGTDRAYKNLQEGADDFVSGMLHRDLHKVYRGHAADYSKYPATLDLAAKLNTRGRALRIGGGSVAAGAGLLGLYQMFKRPNRDRQVIRG